MKPQNITGQWAQSSSKSNIRSVQRNKIARKRNPIKYNRALLPNDSSLSILLFSLSVIGGATGAPQEIQNLASSGNLAPHMLQ